MGAPERYTMVNMQQAALPLWSVCWQRLISDHAHSAFAFRDLERWGSDFAVPMYSHGYLLYRFEDISFLTPLKSSKLVVMHSYICLLYTLKNFHCIHSLMLYDVVISGETSSYRKLLNASESNKPNFFYLRYYLHIAY